MQVRLEKAFPIAAPASNAWRVLQDVRSVAECMPGARITEQLDDRHYNGQMTLKIGPASATFKGTIEVRRADAGNQQIEISGKGADVKGASAASLDLTARIRAADGGCELVGVSEVTVSGKLVNFGGRMMTQVSDQLLQQFGANFSNRVLALGEGESAQAAAARVSGQPRELNALVLLWRTLIGFFRSLFGARKSGPPG